jgi:hypothetical protein
LSDQASVRPQNLLSSGVWCTNSSVKKAKRKIIFLVITRLTYITHIQSTAYFNVRMFCAGYFYLHDGRFGYLLMIILTFWINHFSVMGYSCLTPSSTPLYEYDTAVALGAANCLVSSSGNYGLCLFSTELMVGKISGGYITSTWQIEATDYSFYKAYLDSSGQFNVADSSGRIAVKILNSGYGGYLKIQNSGNMMLYSYYDNEWFSCNPSGSTYYVLQSYSYSIQTVYSPCPVISEVETNYCDAPTMEPTYLPSRYPTPRPTVIPTIKPTTVPSYKPSQFPTPRPTVIPTEKPTTVPSYKPSQYPTPRPTVIPTEKPTTVPSYKPTQYPTHNPSVSPSSRLPTFVPSYLPYRSPTTPPTAASNPTATTCLPTLQPTTPYGPQPTSSPSEEIYSCLTPSSTPLYEYDTAVALGVANCLFSSSGNYGLCLFSNKLIVGTISGGYITSTWQIEATDYSFYKAYLDSSGQFKIADSSGRIAVKIPNSGYGGYLKIQNSGNMMLYSYYGNEWFSCNPSGSTYYVLQSYSYSIQTVYSPCPVISAVETNYCGSPTMEPTYLPSRSPTKNVLYENPTSFPTSFVSERPTSSSFDFSYWEYGPSKSAIIGGSFFCGTLLIAILNITLKRSSVLALRSFFAWADFVTDICFISQVWSELNWLNATKDVPDPRNPSVYFTRSCLDHDCTLWQQRFEFDCQIFVCATAFLILPCFVNIILIWCVSRAGWFQYWKDSIDEDMKEKLPVVNTMAVDIFRWIFGTIEYFWSDNTPKTLRAALILLYPVHGILALLIGFAISLISWVLLSVTHMPSLTCGGLTNLMIFWCCTTNAELASEVYGPSNDPLKFAMSLTGVLFEDIPQFVIQIVYALVTQNCTWLQWLSFSFSAWRASFVLTLKYLHASEKDPVKYSACNNNPQIPSKDVEITSSKKELAHDVVELSVVVAELVV